MEVLDTTTKLYKPELDAQYPSSLHIPSKDDVEVKFGDTAFGISWQSTVSIHLSLDHPFTIDLLPEMYFCVPGPARISNLDGFCCIREGYEGVLSVGGPLEDRGRLTYINGCSDSVLIHPAMKGDPCFNFLFVPPGTSQDHHTHPTVRVGLVTEGSGLCRFGDGRESTMSAGSVFVLPPDEEHSFHTTDHIMKIAVYHPDSDIGPTHEGHPMLNRTYIEGRSANREPVGQQA